MLQVVLARDHARRVARRRGCLGSRSATLERRSRPMRSVVVRGIPARLCAVLLLLCSACAETEPNNSVAEADAHQVMFLKGYEWSDLTRQLTPGPGQTYQGQLSDSRDVDTWAIKPLSDGNWITFSAWVAPTIASGQCMRVSLFKCTKPGVTSFATCPQANKYFHFQQWPICPKLPGDLSGTTFPTPMPLSKDELMWVSVLRTGTENPPTQYFFALASP